MTDGDRQDIEDLKAISGGSAATVDRAMTALYRRHGGWLRRFFSASRLDWATTDDLIQEVFKKVFRCASSYRGEAPASAWMRIIAKRVLLSYLEKLKTDPLANPVPEPDSAPNGAVDTDSPAETPREPAEPDAGMPLPQRLRIEACVSRQLQVFARDEPLRAEALRRKCEGWSDEEIADFLERPSVGAARQFLHESRKKVRTYMEPCRDLLRGERP